MRIIKNYSLKNHNSFAVDAVAEKYMEFDSDEEIIQYVKNGNLTDKYFFILGGGTNTLFIKSFDGIVLKYMLDKIEIIKQSHDKIEFLVSANTSWDKFVNTVIDSGFNGIENLACIPGTVGAAAVQNIGAYGIEQDIFFKHLEAIDLRNGEKKIFNKNECCFGYRYSIFKNSQNPYLITKICYEFTLPCKYHIDYLDLKELLKNKKLSARSIYNAVAELRSQKLPDHREFPNAGSFFKNPVIDKKHFNNLIEKYPDIKYFDNEHGVKISAAWLIENCGWKGKQIGGVGVSAKHSLIIINYLAVSGKEIYDFSKQIVASVHDKFNITLIPEVIII